MNIEDLNQQGNILKHDLMNFKIPNMDQLDVRVETLVNQCNMAIDELCIAVSTAKETKGEFRMPDYKRTAPKAEISDTKLFKKLMQHNIVVKDTSRVNVRMFYNDIQAIGSHYDIFL